MLREENGRLKRLAADLSFPGQPEVGKLFAMLSTSTLSWREVIDEKVGPASWF